MTDGPYGIGFMGRKWDTFNPGKVKQASAREGRGDCQRQPKHQRPHRSPAISPSQIEYDYWLRACRVPDVHRGIGAEVFRVLKPGAYIVSAAARAHHRMMCGRRFYKL